MKVIYVCYTDFSDLRSGSGVRPYKIYNAFLEKGYDVLLINGDLRSRRAKFLKLKKSGAFTNVDYCYIEPSSYPIHPIDYLMLFYFKRKGIPSGLFYRDMYHKYPELFKKKGMRRIFLLLRYRIDWYVYTKTASTIFFPSDTMAAYFDFHTKAALPPGSEMRFIKRDGLNHNVIYVGGLSERYGTKILLDALKIVNERMRVDLFLVCRNGDFSMLDEYRGMGWLHIMNLSGGELENCYAESDFALIPLLQIEYHEFAVPVKLFEYLSFGLPVLATDCKETADFIRSNGVGEICSDDPASIAGKIEELYRDPDRLKKISGQVEEVVARRNLWTHRIDEIEKYLLRSEGRGLNDA